MCAASQDYDPRWVAAFKMISDGVFGDTEYFDDLVASVNDIPARGNDWFLVANDFADYMRAQVRSIAAHHGWCSPKTRLLVTDEHASHIKGVTLQSGLCQANVHVYRISANGMAALCSHARVATHMGGSLTLCASNPLLISTLVETICYCVRRMRWINCTRTMTSGHDEASSIQPVPDSLAAIAPSTSMLMCVPLIMWACCMISASTAPDC